MTSKSDKIRVSVVGGFPSGEEYPNTYNIIRTFRSSPEVELVDVYGGIESLRLSSVTGWLYKLKVVSLLLVTSLVAAIKIRATDFRSVDVVYLPYPCLLVTTLYRLICLGHRRPILIGDSFISIYDTVVNDRKLIAGSTFLAKSLLRVERASLSLLDVIVVDTMENASFYSRLFNLSIEKFLASPLFLDESVSDCSKIDVLGPREPVLKVIFFGTFVPLQGVPLIFSAARILSARNVAVKFTVIGSGQTAPECGEVPDNMTWIKSWVELSKLVEFIRCADICLGVFGQEGKVDRVWPYKNYWSMLLGKVVVTGAKVDLVADAPAYFLSERSSESLAGLLEDIAVGAFPLMLSTDIKGFYDANLSNQVGLSALLRRIREIQVIDKRSENIER